jgi:hypothetical protein
MEEGWMVFGVAVREDVVKETVSRGKVVLGGIGLVRGKLTDSGEDREIYRSRVEE